jgi:gliding motility-associated-like protein
MITMSTSIFWRGKAAFPFFFAIFFLFLHQKLTAQAQANIWHFGYRAGIDFSSGLPLPLPDVEIDANEGCATQSDAQGNLLFYTNGGGATLDNALPNGVREGYIWNSNQQVMYDMGQSEGGGYSAGQGALILPVIGSDHEYYLFTMDQHSSLTTAAGNRGLRYYIIDMNLNGGLGGVSLANQPIFSPATECLTVVRHANGTDYWLVAIDQNTKDFVVVPVTAAGVQTPFLQDRQSNSSINIVMKASPNGQFLYCNYELYRFDPATGDITFAIDIFESSGYSFSFSPTSQYLYMMGSDFGDLLTRYDVTAANILGSREVIASLGLVFAGGMQIGPDGHLYMVDIGEDQAIAGTVAISQVECPDSQSPTFNRAIMEFEAEPGIGSFFGLPNFPDFLFDTPPVLVENDTLKICAGDTVELASGFMGETYLWSTGQTVPSIAAFQPGSYSLSITNSCGREIAVHHFLVELKPSNPVEGQAVEVSKCTGAVATLQALPGANIYQWSTGEGTASITVSEAGSYKVTVTDECSVEVQTFNVTDQPAPAVEFVLGSQEAYCLGDTVRLEALAPGANSFLWSSGDTSAIIRAAAGQSYSVLVENECGENSATFLVPGGDCCLVYIPNVFSPNGDGLNDSFVPYFGDCELLDYHLQVFSRWGAVVFDSNNPDTGWDGSFRGKAMQPDVFVFQLQYSLKTPDGESSHLRAGDVLIVQ